MKFISKFDKLEDLSEEPPTKIYLLIPDSINKAIEECKSAYQEAHGRLPKGGKKAIINLLLVHGLEGLKKEAEILKVGSPA